MAVMSFKYDNRIAEDHRDLLRSHCTSIDNDLADLARDLGLKVFEEDLMPYQDGFLTYDPSCGSATGFKIVVNSKHNLSRKRFSVAHEIGHFVLHRNDVEYLKDKVAAFANTSFQPKLNRVQERDTLGFDYESLEDRAKEKEANAFASALLMPTNFFKPSFIRLNGDIETLAQLFLVSPEAVRRRIRELKLL